MRLIPALAVIAALAATPGLALAANARNPYGNIDPRVDAGNDTGDSQVDRLNQSQLNHGPLLRPAYPRPAYPRPVYVPRPAYYPPYRGYGW